VGIWCVMIVKEIYWCTLCTMLLVYDPYTFACVYPIPHLLHSLERLTNWFLLASFFLRLHSRKNLVGYCCWLCTLQSHSSFSISLPHNEFKSNAKIYANIYELDKMSVCARVQKTKKLTSEKVKWNESEARNPNKIKKPEENTVCT
jgi:hypothetical protein